MKFNYTKLINGVEHKAGCDLAKVWHYTTYVDKGVTTLVLHLNLPPIEVYKDFPRYNSKSNINGIDSKKVTEHPVVILTKEKDVEDFLYWWNKMD